MKKIKLKVWIATVSALAIGFTLGYSPINSSLLRLWNSSNKFTSLKAASGLGTSYEVTFPDDAGAAGQTLVNQGSGVLDWETATGGVRSWITGDSSDFENSAGDWAEYDDGATATPVDGTGSTAANLTVTRTTTGGEVLAGAASLKIAKAAADAQGEGISLAFSIDVAQQGQLQAVPFIFKTGSNYVNEHYKMFVYDVTNAQLLNVFTLDNNNGSLFTSPSTGTFFSGVFVASGSSTSYRLIIHSTSTTATAFDFFIDEIKPGPISSALVGFNSHGWIAYTPDITGFGTESGVTFFYMRKGDSVKLRGFFTGGTSEAAAGRLPLPSGMSLDTAKLSGDQKDQLGWWYGDVDSTAVNTPEASKGPWPLVFDSASTTSLAFGRTVDSDNTFFNVDNIGGFVSNNTFQSVLTDWIPISGFQDSSVMSQHMAQLQTVSARATGDPASAADGAPIIFPTETWDEYGLYDNSTGQFDCPRPGKLKVYGFVGSASAASTLGVYKNGSLYATVAVLVNGDAVFDTSVDVVKDDLIDIRPIGAAMDVTTGFVTFEYFPDLSVVGLLGQGIRYQIKKLTSDLTSDTNPVTDLTLSNLEVGKTYRLTMAPQLLSTTGEGTLTAIHNGSNLIKANINGTSIRVNLTRTIDFLAAATTVTFNFDENTVATLEGNDDTLETYVMIEELPIAQAVTIH